MREWLRQLVKIQRSAEAAAGQNRGWSKHFQSPGSAGPYGPLDPSGTDGQGPSAFCTYRLFPLIEELLIFFNKYLHRCSLDWPFRCLDQQNCRGGHSIQILESADVRSNISASTATPKPQQIVLRCSKVGMPLNF